VKATQDAQQVGRAAPHPQTQIVALAINATALAGTLTLPGNGMTETTFHARRMFKKEFRARIDRIIAEEERTYGELLELRDRVHAIITEFDRAARSPVDALPNISKIIAMPSQFPWRLPRRFPDPRR
jgi:hypothetical protein